MEDINTLRFASVASSNCSIKVFSEDAKNAHIKMVSASTLKHAFME
jgi:hypothetical protein